MELSYVPPDLRRLDELPTEVLVATLFSDERPPRGLTGLLSWRLAGRVDRLLESGFVTGACGEVVLIPGRPRLTAEKVLLFGLGPRAAFDEGVFDEVAAHVLRTLSGLSCRTAVIELPGRHVDALAPELAADRFLAAAAQSEGSFDRCILVERSPAQKRIEGHLVEARRRVRKW